MQNALQLLFVCRLLVTFTVAHSVLLTQCIMPVFFQINAKHYLATMTWQMPYIHAYQQIDTCYRYDDEVQFIAVGVADVRDHKQNHSSGGVRWTGLLRGPKTNSDRV